MSLRNNEKSETATNLASSPKPQKLNSKSIPDSSPPNSPDQAPRVSRDETCPAGAVSSLPSPPTTPPRQSSALTAHEKQPTEARFNATILRTSLGLDDNRCGALTKANRPCRSRTPVSNRAGVTSQLESIIALTQSSMELEVTLDKLAKLVHCKHHTSSVSKKERIEAWIKIFPVGEASITDPATAVEKGIRKSLSLKSAQCIGIVDSVGSRCLLKVLETNIYCPQHINKQPLQKVASWKLSIAEILEEHSVKLAESSIPEKTRGPSGAPNRQGSPESPSTSRSDDLVLRSGRLLIPNFDRDLSTYWPTKYNTSPFEIIARSDRVADSKSSYDMVKGEILRELHDMDQRDGQVYMYKVEGNPGFVKIGYTTRFVEERLQEWDFDCNRASKALYPISLSTAAAIPNARRVEALCHAELDHRRIMIYCHGCLKQHLEWFEIPSTEAITVIQKWSDWMATRPYQSTQLRNKTKWTIKEEERTRTRDMDRFMREISGVSRQGDAGKYDTDLFLRLGSPTLQYLMTVCSSLWHIPV
ncbi:T5orf172 domain-containing protein [Fusarium oxysporum f. sp. albedinis]|nr:T5orf172 domain-containing protein [Fusarium oxysporum f. sp. albedinis]